MNESSNNRPQVTARKLAEPEPERSVPGQEMKDGVTIPVPEKFDLIANTYDDTPPEYYGQWDGPALMDVIGDVTGKRILDVGCGTGRLLERLRDAGAAVTGIDVSRRMVEQARRRGLNVFHSDITAFETDECFDVVVSVLTFNYIENKASALHTIHSLLETRGRLVIASDEQTEDTAVPRGKEAVTAPYFPCSKDEYKDLLKQSGFCVEKTVDLLWAEQYGSDQAGDAVGFIIQGTKSDK